MGVLSRFRDIMASNVNALLDRAEDPAKTIDAYMRNVNSDLGKVKAETAAVLADESRAKRVLDECKAEIEKLQRYAEKAVEAGNEEDARMFLDKKAAAADKKSQLQAAYETASSNAANMKQMQDKLVSDISQLEARRVNLKAKMAAVKTQQNLNAKSSSVGFDDSVFDNMEEKANMAYNEAMAIAELRAEKKDDLDELFAEFEKSTNSGESENGSVNTKSNSNTNTNMSTEDELAAIKEQLKKKK
ncbi:PspA/IM30 family protein [Paenibacillus eucommiae]|uniref:Phage shock protein A n=1 Tax=Paenibacillus eucommiae TaxID=1355755 RepID=A0ABS4J2U1_9BACL|nr:PspA/IM30 family protein [Paenibacillus eucommiae]MBP1994128.1 phage shock protein A [Paenibacillus eucommiae]